MEPGTEDWADKVTLEGVHKLQKKVQGTCNAIKKSQILKSFFAVLGLKYQCKFQNYMLLYHWSPFKIQISINVYITDTA